MLCSVVQCTGNIIVTYVVLLLALCMVMWLYPGLYCAVVPLFIVVERIAVTSAVHERLSSQVVQHAEHYSKIQNLYRLRYVCIQSYATVLKHTSLSIIKRSWKHWTMQRQLYIRVMVYNLLIKFLHNWLPLIFNAETEQQLLAQWPHHKCSSRSAEGQWNTWSAEYTAGRQTYIWEEICLFKCCSQVETTGWQCQPLAVHIRQ